MTTNLVIIILLIIIIVLLCLFLLAILLVFISLMLTKGLFYFFTSYNSLQTCEQAEDLNHFLIYFRYFSLISKKNNDCLSFLKGKIK